MKRVLTALTVLIYSSVLACGGDYWDGMSYYNLFAQTCISEKGFYPFLRDSDHAFYGDSNYQERREGNIALWKEVFPNWSEEDIRRAVYGSFNWPKQKTPLENRAAIYIDFAQTCSKKLSYRHRSETWDYDEIINTSEQDQSELLTQAMFQLNEETNAQLKARYYYQIIRLFHYSKNWEDAVRFFESQVENKLPKNEIYYYIIDQVAGCYYSLKQFDKAAYLFSKVVSKSVDRKESAFLSFNFCAYESPNLKTYAISLEDEKDLLLVQSLSNFSDDINNLQKFIQLDANDARVELLFIRALNNVERDVLPKDIGVSDKTLPYYGDNKNYKELLKIAEKQAQNTIVKNTDFWNLSSSYLLFINNKLDLAKQKLKLVHTLAEQKKSLEILYEIFSWTGISDSNEKYLLEVLAELYKEEYAEKDDLVHIVLDYIAHVYYKNGQIAKAFLVHNSLEDLKYISSLSLLNALEKFYEKSNKNGFEQKLVSESLKGKDYLGFVNQQKGIYYIKHLNSKLALECFNKVSKPVLENKIPKSVFSNNTKECFECDVEEMMLDEVYKSKAFSFIKEEFEIDELTTYLIALSDMAIDKVQWKAKLANYLLGNFYFNISNTGYYRGVLYGDGNCCDYNYFSYYDYFNENNLLGENIIRDNKGYNLSNIRYFDKRYFELSEVAETFYQKVLDLSTDKELNARCAFLISKCELNSYYNGKESQAIFTVRSTDGKFELPKTNGFKLLKEKYADSKFHDMIINECSYFRHYSNAN